MSSYYTKPNSNYQRELREKLRERQGGVVVNPLEVLSSRKHTGIVRLPGNIRKVSAIERAREHNLALVNKTQRLFDEAETFVAPAGATVGGRRSTRRHRLSKRRKSRRQRS